jgi:recombination protein RecT
MATQNTAALEKYGVLDVIEKAKGDLGARLPDGMTQQRFVYGLMTSVQKNPDLLKCNPRSVLLAAYEAAECGCDLSPSKAMGWLIPYKETAQFQPSYRHFIQTAYKSGVVKAFNAEVVFSNDKFKIIFAPVRTVIHEPKLGDRGKPVGVYAIIQFLDDHIDFEYLSLDEIERHRKHSKMPDSLMWKSFWEEGARKTAIRVLAKRLPQTNPAMERLAEIVQKDADAELEPAPNGAVELDAASPLRRAVENGSQVHPEPVELRGAEESAAPTEVARPIVNFFVGAQLTFINGQTQPIEKDLRKLFPKREEAMKAWSIPATSTEDFLTICEQQGVSAIETDKDWNPLPIAQTVDLFDEHR